MRWKQIAFTGGGPLAGRFWANVKSGMVVYREATWCTSKNGETGYQNHIYRIIDADGTDPLAVYQWDLKTKGERTAK